MTEGLSFSTIDSSGDTIFQTSIRVAVVPTLQSIHPQVLVNHTTDPSLKQRIYLETTNPAVFSEFPIKALIHD
jgi:hypothetical protein